jgi:peptide deformylase
MMKLIYAPNHMLETPVEKFDFENLNPIAIAEEMIEVMEKHNGIGLAANQVGLNGQVFVMKPQISMMQPFAVFDPIIRGLSKEIEEGEESCLSYPDLVIKVKRPKSVMIEYTNTAREQKQLKLNDMDARIFLHEYDHLHGINFVDRISKLKLDMAVKKSQKRKKIYGRT